MSDDSAYIECVSDDKTIGFQAIVSNDGSDDGYEMHIRTAGASLGQLSLLLACLHLIEKEIIDHIDSIQPEFEVTK